MHALNKDTPFLSNHFSHKISFLELYIKEKLWKRKSYWLWPWTF